ncbi:MAG: folylpolyglutamate synthase/dihydrofolate synthase family protein [Dehalococcoidia bacterium]
MHYREALRLLHRRDDWERSGSADDAARWDLRRMRSLLARLGDPQLGRRTVHAAGSKGKGSTAAMIAAVLRAAGETAGLYTSPHLHRFVERIAVDGEPIAEDDFGRLMDELLPAIETEEAAGPYGTISTFEALTALSFLAFRERGVTVQVLEVGLGGRLDATNVIDDKDVCVITPVGLEHTAVLGDTVAKIAAEKAGIITKGSTVIMAPQRESAADVVRQVAAERSAELIEVAQACSLSRGRASSDGQEFTLKTPRETYKLTLPLLGRHQLDNAATAVLALEALAARAGIEIGAAAIREGFSSVRWPCRIEALKRKPLIIVDGAHDRDSARRLAQTIRDDFGRSSVVFVIGASRDKDIDALADELAPIVSNVVLTKSRNPRAMDARNLVPAFTERELPVAVEEPVGAAVDAALAIAGADGAIVVCGSLFVAAEAKEHILGIVYDPPIEGLASSRPSQSEVGV